MNKKQFEDIENKFREAAENFQPPLTEEAWQKMEQLLDRKEPVKRRAGGFWLTSLLLLLLLTAGTGIYYYYGTTTEKLPVAGTQAGHKETVPPTQPKSNEHTSVPLKKDPSSAKIHEDRKTNADHNNNGTEKADVTLKTKEERIVTNEKSLPALKKLSQRSAPTKGPGPSIVQQKRTPEDDGMSEVKKNLAVNNLVSETDKQSLPSRRSNAYKQPDNNKRDNPQQVTADTKSGKKETAVTGLKPDDAANAVDKQKQAAVAKATNQPPATKKAANQQTNRMSSIAAKELEQQKRMNNFLSRFSFTASVASDGNAVQGSNIKKLSAMYGVGVGYNLNSRFVIQTGLYGGSKRYSADSSAYYRKPGYWRMVKIRNIDADCFVYNIPLSLRYNITNGRVGKLYGVAGLSSYFMQKETYDYYYSYYNVDSLRHRKEVYGDNNHLFAVLDLSAGYEHKFSKHFSILGEPYLKLPLKGIGEGKVHLYSAGVMFGLKFQP
jgi:hypothetical protein